MQSLPHPLAPPLLRAGRRRARAGAWHGRGRGGAEGSTAQWGPALCPSLPLPRYNLHIILSLIMKVIKALPRVVSWNSWECLPGHLPKPPPGHTQLYFSSRGSATHSDPAGQGLSSHPWWTGGHVPSLFRKARGREERTQELGKWSLLLFPFIHSFIHFCECWRVDSQASCMLDWHSSTDLQYLQSPFHCFILRWDIIMLPRLTWTHYVA